MANIDFARLDLRDALDLAILIEDEAEERYEEFADLMQLHHTPDAERFFRTMAVNEAKHRSELMERRGRLFPDAPRTVTREMLWDVEAPGYEKAEVFMSARKAMEVALEGEEDLGPVEMGVRDRRVQGREPIVVLERVPEPPHAGQQDAAVHQGYCLQSLSHLSVPSGSFIFLITI